MRRCSHKNAPKAMQPLMLRINELMDGHNLAGYMDEALHGPVDAADLHQRTKDRVPSRSVCKRG